MQGEKGVRFRRDLFAMASLLLAILTLTALVLFPQFQSRILHPLGIRSNQSQSGIGLIGSSLILGFALLSWRNDVELSIRSQPSSGSYHEDYAITKAKALWNQKRPREAVQALIARINELNQEQPAQPERKFRFSAVLLGILATLAVVGLVVLLWGGKRIETIFQHAELKGYCERNVDDYNQDCEKWASWMLDRFPDEVDDCLDQYGVNSDFARDHNQSQRDWKVALCLVDKDADIIPNE